MTPAVFFLRLALTTWGPFWFYTTERTVCSVFVKNAIFILFKIECIQCFGWMSFFLKIFFLTWTIFKVFFEFFTSFFCFMFLLFGPEVCGILPP